MKIDVARLEFCATSQRLGGELGFDRAQTIYLSWNKDEQLQIVADIRKTHDRVSIAFRVTEVVIRLSHRRNINGRSTANVEWLRLCPVLGKFTGPRGLQIKRVRQDEPGCLTQRSLGNQIANPVVCLVGDPFVNLLRSSPGVSNEIKRLKCRAVIVCQVHQKSRAKRISLLSEKPVGGVQRDRVTGASRFLRLFHLFSRLCAHLFK